MTNDTQRFYDDSLPSHTDHERFYDENLPNHTENQRFDDDHLPSHTDNQRFNRDHSLRHFNNNIKQLPKITSRHSNVNDVNQYTADPFQCRLQIRTSRGEANFLRNLFSPLLEGIDPTFQFINLEEKETFEPLTAWNQTYENDYDEEGMVCPAISIVLFLSEAFGQLSANSVQSYLSSEPWRFHHRIELPKDVRPQITARQDFYQAFHGHPLWSVLPVHYGNEHLRFHIVVKDFLNMRSFYERITGIRSRDGSPGFCLIPLYTQTGLDIQLSLKCLPQVYPKPCNVARLRFKIPNIETLLPYLVGCPLPMPNQKGAWLTNDPDGNVIILEETDPADKDPRTSDYDSGSLDSESIASSLGSSDTVRNSRTMQSDLV